MSQCLREKNMVAPVTGPFTTDRSSGSLPGAGYPSERIRRTTRRQVKPYNLPLAYEFDGRKAVTPFSGKWSGSNIDLRTESALTPFGLDSPDSVGPLTYCRIDAAKRFNAKVGEQASWLVSLAEHKSALSMISTRARQLARFAVAIKKGRLRDAVAALEYSKPVHVSRLKKFPSSKDLANTWLEWWFGWSPLVADIQNSVKLLQSTIPDGKIFASAKYTSARIDLPTGSGYAWTDHRMTHRCKTGATVRVNNSNLFLADRLGLTDILKVGYELVPFSFVANWFFTVEEFLENFSDTSGLTVLNHWYTQSCEDKMTYRQYNPPPVGVALFTRLHIRRTIGELPFVPLMLRKPWTLSPTRALTSMSLLTQMLPAKKGL